MVYRIGSIRAANDSGIAFRRAGIIPYIKIDGEPLYFFMVDARYGQLTDPGGRINPKEDWINAAIREAAEETRGTFDFRDKRQEVIDSGVTVWSEEKGTVLIFLQIETTDPFGLCISYRMGFVEGVKRSEPRQALENSMMIFVAHTDLQALASVPLRQGSENVHQFYDASDHPMPPSLSLLASASHDVKITMYPHLYSRIRLPLRKRLKDLIMIL